MSSAVVVVTVYQVVMLMSLLPFSALGDRVGHRRLYQTGQLVFLAASLGSAMATSLPMLLARYDVRINAHVVGPPPDSAAACWPPRTNTPVTAPAAPAISSRRRPLLTSSPRPQCGQTSSPRSQPMDAR